MNLLFRVLYWGPLFSETPIWSSELKMVWLGVAAFLRKKTALHKLDQSPEPYVGNPKTYPTEPYIML